MPGVALTCRESARGALWWNPMSFVLGSATAVTSGHLPTVVEVALALVVVVLPVVNVGS